MVRHRSEIDNFVSQDVSWACGGTGSRRLGFQLGSSRAARAQQLQRNELAVLSRVARKNKSTAVSQKFFVLVCVG